MGYAYEVMCLVDVENEIHILTYSFVLRYNYLAIYNGGQNH